MFKLVLLSNLSYCGEESEKFFVPGDLLYTWFLEGDCPYLATVSIYLLNCSLIYNPLMWCGVLRSTSLMRYAFLTYLSLECMSSNLSMLTIRRSRGLYIFHTPVRAGSQESGAGCCRGVLRRRAPSIFALGFPVWIWSWVSLKLLGQVFLACRGIVQLG